MSVENKNYYEKVSKLHIRTKKNKDRDYLEHVEFTAPFKITKPFYDAKNHMSVMVLSVSAGIMEGDCQDIDIQVGKDSEATIYSQSYEKIHKMNHGIAQRKTKVYVEKNGLLRYTPLPTIPFANSAFYNQIDMDLEDQSARLFYGEILSAGRVGRGELFDYKVYKSLTKVRVGGKLIYYDNVQYEPEKKTMDGVGMFEGFTHLLNILFVNFENQKEVLPVIREIITDTPDIEGGASLMQSGDICVKVLAHNSEVLLKLQDEIYKQIN